MSVYLKVTFILIGLLSLSKCESVLGNIDAITIEIDLDNDNSRETTKKSQFVFKAPTAEYDETTVNFVSEANGGNQKNIMTTSTEDSKILSGREGDSESDFDNSTVNAGVDNRNNLVTFVEEFLKNKEQKVTTDDDPVIKLHSKTHKRFHKKQKVYAHNFLNEPTPTSEALYETKWPQESSYYTNEHENKVTGKYAPLDEKVHNLLHRYKTTPAVTTDDQKSNENEINFKSSPNLNRIKALTPLTSITYYDHIPTKTTSIVRRFKDSTESYKDLTHLNKERTDHPKELITLINPESTNKINNNNDPIQKEFSDATRKNVNDENIFFDHADKETVRDWIPLNTVKDTQEKNDNTVFTDKDEVKETETIVPITWIPEYEIKHVTNDTSDFSVSVTAQVTNDNFSIRQNASTDLESTTEIVQKLTSSATENKITIMNKTNKYINIIKCKYAKNISDFDINKLTGVLKTVYYTMPDKIPCFKMFVMKLSNEMKKQYNEIYGDFQGRINWTKCELEIKAETKIQRKHFLQSSELSDGIFENKIIVEEDANADADEKPTLVEDSPDQWSVVNNLVLLRDCKTGRVLFFKKNPHYRVSHRELKEALFAAGEGFNGRLSCRHKGHDEDF